MELYINPIISPIKNLRNPYQYSPISNSNNVEHTGLTPYLKGISCNDNITGSPNSIILSPPDFELSPFEEDLCIDRNEVINRFFQLLKSRKCSQMYGLKMLNIISQSMENELYNSFYRDANLYNQKYRDLCHFMTDCRYNLADRILLGSVNYKDLPYYTVNDMEGDYSTRRSSV